jgi:hypothetical protein
LAHEVKHDSYRLQMHGRLRFCIGATKAADLSPEFTGHSAAGCQKRGGQAQLFFVTVHKNSGEEKHAAFALEFRTGSQRYHVSVPAMSGKRYPLIDPTSP